MSVTRVSVYAALLLCIVGLFQLVVSNAEDAGQKRINVLCTFWPEYVFALNVTSDIPEFKLDVLLPQTSNPHGYQLSPADLKKVAEADIIIANGYVEEFLDRIVAAYPKKPLVKTADAVRLIPAVHHDEDVGEDEHEHHHGKWNPHTWLSPLNAALEVEAIRVGLTRVAPLLGMPLMSNTRDFQIKMINLKAEMTLGSLMYKSRNIVTFHNAFDYLARDLDLNVVAVIMDVVGVSPTPDKIAAIIKKIKESGGAAVFTEPQFPDNIAKLIAEQTGIETSVLDPGVNSQPTKESYEMVMRLNNASLFKALGGGK